MCDVLDLNSAFFVFLLMAYVGGIAVGFICSSAPGSGTK